MPMNHSNCLAAAISVILASPAGAENFNCAEALQKSLYFYEAQQNGPLSPNNRVPWADLPG